MQSLIEEKGISQEVVDVTEYIYLEMLKDIQTLKADICGRDCLFSNELHFNIFGNPLTINYKVLLTNDETHIAPYTEYYGGNNVYQHNAIEQSIDIRRVILIFDNITPNINVVDYTPFSKTILSHELKHAYQSIKRGSKPLLNYKNRRLYQIAIREIKTYRGSKRNTIDWYKYEIAFGLYSLNAIEITANQQKDWQFICDTCKTYDEAQNFLNNNECESKRQLKISQQILNHLEKNKTALDDYLLNTYKRNTEWVIKFIKDGEWKCNMALKRIDKLIKKRFLMEEDTYIDTNDSPAFIPNNNFKNMFD